MLLSHKRKKSHRQKRWSAMREERNLSLILEKNIGKTIDYEHDKNRGSSLRPPILKSCKLPTQQRGSTSEVEVLSKTKERDVSKGEKNEGSHRAKRKKTKAE